MRIPSSILLPVLVAAAVIGARSGPAHAQNVERMSVDALVERLSDPDPVVRARTVCRLEDLESRARSAERALIKLLGDDARLPRDVCRDIGGRRDWYRGHCEERGDECYTTPGEKAAGALTQIGELDIPAVVRVLNDGEEHARRNAAWLLGAEDAHDALDDLIAALGDESGRVREQAAWALGAIGDDRAADRLVGTVDDPRAEVRENAAWALGAIGSERAVPTLERLARDQNDEVAEHAAWALGAIGDRAGVDVLVELLGHEDAGIREHAAWALGAIGDESAVDALIDLFQKDENNEVRRKAIWALLAIR
jgi:HEAT repeat protein